MMLKPYIRVSSMVKTKTVGPKWNDKIQAKILI